MFGLGMGEIVVILVVALLVLGPTQLPEAAKQVGKAIRQLRRHTRDLQETIEKDEAIGGTMRELKSALRGDELDNILPRDRRLPPEEKPVAKEEAKEQAKEEAKEEVKPVDEAPAAPQPTAEAPLPAEPPKTQNG